ncbi:helix-turn-helix domain-containing protein [Prevotella intermedia]|uniref:helix-turn-helix domain-containing protein n=1 Tax=Prevotella intermedia TaxID=28131 RepID=UPI00117F8BD4|nr:helix-turn-helix domain-containing protein [Prevotella intermedia]
MSKRKPIKLKYGGTARLAKLCRVSRQTVWKAINWNADTDMENLIRQKAKELGLIKKF